MLAGCRCGCSLCGAVADVAVQERGCVAEAVRRVFGADASGAAHVSRGGLQCGRCSQLLPVLRPRAPGWLFSFLFFTFLITSFFFYIFIPWWMGENEVHCPLYYRESYIIPNSFPPKNADALLSGLGSR